MKRLIILFFLLVFNFSLFAQWKVLNEGHGVNNVIFSSENVGWMIGHETLLKTEDGGENWQRLPWNYDLYFTYVNFFDDRTGLAYGFSKTRDYRIFKTEDGGVSWHGILNLSDDGFGLYENNISFLTDSIFFRLIKIDTVTHLKRTVDAGETWTESFPAITNPNFSLPVFINSTTGFLSGDNIFLRTNNGGASWNEMFQSSLEFNDIQFVNDSTGFLLHRNPEDGQLVVYATSDTGRTWVLRITPEDGTFIKTIGFVSLDTVYAVISSDQETELMISTDSGSSWTLVNKLANEWFYGSLSFNRSGRGYMFADLGSGYYGYEGAMVMEKFPDGDWQFLYSAYPIYSLFLIDGQNGFAGGGGIYPHWTYGDILHTNDGGLSWDFSCSVPGIVKDICFINTLNGFALVTSRSGTAVLKTNDGGKTWIRISENDSEVYGLENSVFYFKDEQQGWLAGRNESSAAIFSTLDGGQNWELEWKRQDPSENIKYGFNSLEVKDSIIWIAGESGLVVKSDRSGTFSTMNLGSDLPLKSLFLVDSSKCWIAGGYRQNDNLTAELFRTNNGGISWQKVSLDSVLIKDLFFVDSMKGWAAGEDNNGGGIILETDNGGQTWLTAVKDLRGPLWNFFHRDDELWVSGAYGQILKRDGVSWSDLTAVHNTFPESIELLQNYPNPFNPSTTIEFTLPKSAIVSLKVYNILGSEVSTLVSKKMNHGNHAFTFEGKNLASGIYYYRIEAGDFQDVKKMILLK